MAALTTIALAVGAAAAVGSYATQRSSAKKQERAAEEARLAATFDTQANNNAAMAAVARDKAAKDAAANQALAAEQLDDTPDVTVDPAENNNVRRRRVQAQFNVADGGASASAGSLRI